MFNKRVFFISIELTLFILTGYFLGKSILISSAFLILGFIFAAIAGEMIKEEGRKENRREVLHPFKENQSNPPRLENSS